MKARIIILFCMLFTATKLFSQSVSINTTGIAADTSAILDIASTGKGFLMPRMTQSQRLAIVLPADGLLIFQTDGVKGFYYYHSSTDWTLLASSSGVISSFNGITSGSQSFGTPGTSGTSPNWSSSGSVHTLNIPMSGTYGVTAGLLSNTDWNIFNNKLSSVDTGNIPNFYLKVRGLLSAGSGISYNSTTGIIGNSGVLSLNGNTGALTMDTGYIANYYQKVRGLFSGSAPITLTNGQIGITQSGSSGNGYLSSTDWNIFNNKLSTTTGWTTTGNTGSVAGTNFIGTTDAIDFVTKTNNTERMRVLSGGNVGIGTNAPGSALDVKGTLRLSGSTSGYVGLQPAAAAGSTTYVLPSADGSSGQQLTTNGSGTLSWSNQTGATSVSNTSSANNLSTTVNGVTGSNVSIVNSISNTSSANNLTTTVNGVAATAVSMVNSVANTSSVNNLTTTINGVTGTAVPMVNSVANTSSTNSLTTTINGVAGSSVNIINSNATSLSGNNLTTTVNGVAATALDISPIVAANGWSKTGNNGTTAGTNFVGTTDAIDFVTKTNNTEKMRVTSGGNVGIGTNAPGSALDVKGTLRLSGSTSGYVGLQPAAAAGSTTYVLPSADGSSGQQLTTNGSGTLSWSNQTGATSVSNTSSANNLSTTVNGLAGSNVSIVNSISNTSSANNLTTTVNGVAGTAVPMVNSVSNTSSTNSLTTTINGVAGSAVNIINSNATSLSGTNLTTTVNGVAATALDLTPAINAATINTLGTAGTNIMTSTVNGVTDTALAVNSVSNSISTNSLTTTVNGIAGTALDLSVGLWSKTGNGGTIAVTNFIGTTDAIDFVAKTNNTERFRISSAGNVGINTTGPTNKLHVNGNARITVMAGGLDTDSLMTVGSTGVINKRTVANVLAGGTNTLGSSVNTITSTVNGVAATAPAVNSVSNTSSTNSLTTIINGVAGTSVPMVNSISNTSSANNLSTTVNGVTGSNVSMVNSISNTSSTNSLTTTVNGVAGSSVNIINSNATSLSGNNLTTTVNGVVATALDISPIVAANGWSKTGNSGTTAGTNFVGTTDAIDFVTKTNNTEKMRVTSGGNVGIGTNAPGSALDVKGTLRLSGSTSGYVGLQPAAAAGSTTYVLPSADGTNGQQLTTNGSGTLSWSNQTGSTSVSNTSSANNLSTTVNGVTGSNVSMVNSISNTSSANNLSTTVNGVTGSNVSMVNSISNTSSANNLSTTVNGVTGSNVSMVNSISNTSSTNSLTTTVNGVAGSSVNIINSNATSLSGNNLTTTVNGVVATALDLSPIVAANGWSKTGNSGTTAGTNFVGTTDAIDFVTKTNNTEKMRVTSGGNVGIGTNAPGSALDVKGTLRLSGSTSGYVGLQPAAAAGSTTYTLPSTDGTSGQALLTNGSGTLSWGANKCSLGSIGAGYSIPGTATGTYYCTGSSITLPPGKYIVSVNMMLSGTLNQSSLQPGSFYIKSFFADVSFGTTAGTTMSPALPASNVTSDIVGNAKLISGSISIGQPYNPLAGFVVINNNSGSNKTYYYWMGWVALTNVTPGTSSLSLVGGTNYGEDNIVAFPAN